MVSKEKQQWKSPQTNQYTIRLVSFPRILEEMSLAKPIGGNDKVRCANYEDEFPSPDLIASLLLPFSSNPLPAAYPQFKSYSLLRKKRKVGSLSLFFMIPRCKDSFINLNMKQCCLFITLQTFFYNFHLSEAELFDELLSLEVFYLVIYVACNILLWGYSWEFLVGVWPWFAKSWSYFRPEKCYLSHPFLDLASKIHTSFQTSPLRNYVITTLTETATKKGFLKSMSNSHISLSFLLT